MTTERDPGSKRKLPFVTLTLVVVFALLFFMLLMNSGQYQRYQKKMERQELMKNYIDSNRREEQLKKLR